MIYRKATADDSQLIDLIRTMLDPPSQGILKPIDVFFHNGTTPQSEVVDKILEQKSDGFFVECGAFDGEQSSNTLFFERFRNWTGLLVEADPFFYTQLLGKSRKSWSINGCLSPSRFVTRMGFVKAQGQKGKLRDLKAESDKLSYPCFPLNALLAALNRTSVDYFSLDVEGLELDILKTIPFDKITIKVLSVEYTMSPGGAPAIEKFMREQGYKFYKHLDVIYHPPQFAFVADLIFVKT